MEISNHRQPSFFSALMIGVGSIIGSGWLFASYYASKFAGPVAIVSWIIGAVIALTLALLLGEIATIYQERGLSSRLLTITHNRDFGFIIAISNWFGLIAVIPSEAMATVQYLSMTFPNLSHYTFVGDDLTILGVFFTDVLILVYGLLNYWGVRTLATANNLISSIKLVVPMLTGLVVLGTAFHPQNFTAYHHTIAPYGIDKAFTAVVSCGIFYAFYGFSMISMFAKDLKNPKRNLPLALVGSVAICLVIYLILQSAFIGAMDPSKVATQGWHTLNFTSPLAQLAILLGLNWLSIVLYADAALSPSGTAIVYIGSSAQNLTSMAEDHQVPRFFAHIHPLYHISRSAIIFAMLICFGLVLFFNNWQKIVIVVTVLQLLSCVAIPIAFTKLRDAKVDKLRTFKLPFGKTLSLFAYFIVTYLLTQSGVSALVLALVLHIFFFLVYCASYYKLQVKKTVAAFKSSWTMFAYIVLVAIGGWLQANDILHRLDVLLMFFAVAFMMYILLLWQKNYNE